MRVRKVESSLTALGPFHCFHHFDVRRVGWRVFEFSSSALREPSLVGVQVALCTLFDIVRCAVCELSISHVDHIEYVQTSWIRGLRPCTSWAFRHTPLTSGLR